MATRSESYPLALAAIPELDRARVLVPIIRGQAAAPLLSLGDAIARRGSTQGVVLGLVEIPASRGGLQMAVAKRSRELLRWIAATDYECHSVSGSQLTVQTRIAADVARGIREAALETQSDLVLLEWPWQESPRRYRLEAVLRSLAADPPANLVIVRPDPAGNGPLAPRSVLAPLRGGSNARLALSVAAALATQSEARLTLMHVYGSNHHPDRTQREAAVFHELIQAVRSLDPVVLEVIAPEPAAVLLRAGSEYDAVVMGARARPGRAGNLVGSALESVVNGLPRTVILTRSSRPDAMAAWA
ncbi:MAG: universal stress protein [Candidatus Dormibacteraceae bacterium]